jgi:hypothetical protein
VFNGFNVGTMLLQIMLVTFFFFETSKIDGLESVFVDYKRLVIILVEKHGSTKLLLRGGLFYLFSYCFFWRDG